VAGTFAGEEAIFSHRKHIDEGAECDQCHKEGEADGLPRLESEACGECHDEGPPAGWKMVRARRLRLAFSHPAHARKLGCERCHETTSKDVHLPADPVLRHAECISCHEDSGVEVAERACRVCHGEDPRRRKPSDHRWSWMVRHGTESSWRVFDRHGQDCKQCHRPDVCLTCHKTTRPRSHTLLWRIRSHGFVASWDRQKCRTCHETGACIRCHRTTQPLNHKGSWAASHGLVAQTRDDQHCGVCHRPAWCAACHLGSR
jgi:hypothetical protein